MRKFGTDLTEPAIRKNFGVGFFLLAGFYTAQPSGIKGFILLSLPFGCKHPGPYSKQHSNHKFSNRFCH